MNESRRRDAWTILTYNALKVLVAALQGNELLRLAHAGDTNLGTKGNPTIVLLPVNISAFILNIWHDIQRCWATASS
jgi:hypothetical protein